MLIILLDEPGLFLFPTTAAAEQRIEPIDAASIIRAVFDDRAVPYRVEWIRPNRRRKLFGWLGYITPGEYRLVAAGPPQPSALIRLIELHPGFTDPPGAEAELALLLSKLRAVLTAAQPMSGVPSDRTDLIRAGMESAIFSEGTAANEFRDRIVARWPEWAMHLRRGCDRIELESSYAICAEIPSPADGGPVLIVKLTSGEALVQLGLRGPEKLFIWEDPHERKDAFSEVENFLADIRSAEVVAVWHRHRFLWKMWETAHFERAADAAEDQSVIRVEGWPKAPDS